MSKNENRCEICDMKTDDGMNDSETAAQLHHALFHGNGFIEEGYEKNADQ